MQRTTIELDPHLVAEAKRVLGTSTTRATVEEALRRAVHSGVPLAAGLEGQISFLRGLGERADLDVLAADEMWR